MHLSATSIIGNQVLGLGREPLGEVEDLMVEVPTSRIEYAVMSFGGFLGIGEKLFAVPLTAFTIDSNKKCFILPISKKTLKEAPRFDKNNWPDTADQEWRHQVQAYYGAARCSVT